MEANTSPLQSIIQTSIEQYTDIIQLMESITHAARNLSLEELSKISNQILSKQETATATDKQLLPLLEASSMPIANNKGFVKRMELIERVVHLNRLITPKLTNIKSLMKSELQQVKQGRFAIKGYQQTEIKHGKNLNNTL